MDDQIIRLVADPTAAVAGAAKANAAIASTEAAGKRAAGAAGKAAEVVAGAVVTVTQKSQTSIERMLATLEKRASYAGKSRIERLAVERESYLKQVGGDPAAIERVSAAFDKLTKAAEQGEQGVSGLNASFGRLVGSFSVAQYVVRGIDGITLAVANFVKESALYATRTEQLQFAQNAVARGSDLSTTAVERQARSVQALGITIQDARLGVTRMIAANMDYAKSAQLARLAQDLGRVAGITTAEAFERLTHATVTAQPELLRALGLNVSFEQAYARMGAQLGTNSKELTEAQRRTAALNAVIQAGSRYTGAYEASQKTAGGQILSMNRYWQEAKQALGEQFLPAVTSATAALVDLVKGLVPAIQKGRDFIDTVAVPMSLLVPPVDAIKAAATAWGVMADNAIRFFTAGTFGADDVGAGAGRVASSVRGSQLYRRFDRGAEGYRDFFGSEGVNSMAADVRRRMANASGQADLVQGWITAQNFMREQANTSFAIEQRLGNAISARADAYAQLQKAAVEYQKTGSGIALDIAKDAERRFDAESKTVAALEAQKKSMAEIAKYQEKGREYLGALRAALRGGGLEGSGMEVKALKIDNLELLDNRTKAMWDRGVRGREFENETLAIQNETDEKRLAAQSEFITRERDLQLAALQGVGAVSIQQKMDLEAQRFAITEAALAKEAALQIDAIKRRQELQVQEFEFELGLMDDLEYGYSARAAALMQRRDATISASSQKASEIEEQWITSTGKARADMEASQRQIQYDAWQRHFDSLKRGFESLFDAALMGGQNFASSLKRMLISIFLTPAREASSNWVARMFSPSMAGAGGGGGFSLPGMAGGVSAMTPPFWGGAGGASGSSGGFGGVGGYAAGWKGSLSSLGNIGMGPKLDAYGNPISWGKGIGGWQGGALLAGGGVLAMDGLRRGGVIGLAETTAGGAMIGAKFGGPVGAAIGAGIGAAAGLVRLFIKGREQKIIDQVKSMYGVTIDKQFAKVLAEQSKGQDLRVFLSSAAVREQIQLYADYTNQGGRMGVSDSIARGVNLAQSGGVLSQAGTYVGGTAYGYSSSLPSGGLKAFAPASAQTINVMIQADGQSTSDFLEGKTVQFVSQNGAAVQKGLAEALRVSVGRVTNGAAFMDPLAIRI